MAGAPNSLWRHGDFLRLWSAQSVSAVGSRITRGGLPLVALLVLGAAPWQLGVLAALSQGPGLVVGMFAGGFVDRTRRRHVMIASDLIRAATIISLPIAAWLGLLGMWQLYVVAALVGGASVLFDIADHAYLPSLVDRNQLVEGNAKIATTESLAEIGGPALAGGLIQAFTAPFAMALNAVTYLVSGVILLFIKKPEPPVLEPEEAPHWLSDIRAGFAIVMQSPIVRPLFLTSATQALFGSFFSALYEIYALRTLHLTPLMIGITIAMGGIGALAGASMAPRIVKRFGVGPTIIGSALIGSSAGLLIPFAPAAPFAGMMALIGAQLLGDSFGVVSEINASSLRQGALPPRLLGRAGAIFHVGVGGLAVVGALVGGLLGQAIGMRETLFISVGGLMLAPMWGLFSPLRRLRAIPEPEASEEV